MTDDPREIAARVLTTCSYALPLSEARAQIEERRRRLLFNPAPAQAPRATDPVPPPATDAVVDPQRFADDFWRARSPARPAKSSTSQKSKSAKPRGRRPIGDGLDQRHDKFSVVDGGAGDMADRPR